MKICFVGMENLSVLAREYNKHGIGGEQVQQTLLAKALAELGHEVSMVVADYGQADGQCWAGVKTYKAFSFTAGIPVLRYIHPRWTGLHAALVRANADVYYVSCASAYLGQVVLFAKKYGKQVVFRIAHDYDCEPDKLIISYLRDKKLYEYGLRRVGAVLAQSESQCATMLRNYGVKSRVVSMMVEPAQYQLNFNARNIPVLWVNNLRDFKRPDLMLKLAENLPDIEMHMIGGSMPGFIQMYEEISNKASAIPNIHFHGQVPYHDVNDSYEHAKVFVNTSDSEGFPNSYLQAWVRGTPVVAFFDPDGLIASEGLGFAVKTMEEMQEKIVQLNTDEQLWQQLSEKCKAYMAREYSNEVILAPYIEEFERLNALVNS